MKYKKYIAFILVLCVIISLAVLIYRKRNSIHIDSVERCEVVFVYNGTNASYILSTQELEQIKRIFKGKRIYMDNPSCGFTDKISIIFDDSKTFCIARDTCPIIYWKEEDKYFRITESEKNYLYQLLEKFGFTFPCL